MDRQHQTPPFAWQPLTPVGVAAFTRATCGRLLVVQLVFALLAASTVVSFLQAKWFSVIGSAIKALPSQSEIQAGKLQWTGDAAQSLAESSFLALCVDLKHLGTARSPAHIQVEFGQKDFRVLSLFGCWQGAYPRGWVMAFNRTELEPWWGAWAPALLAMAGIGVVLALIALWSALALLYAPVAWVVGFFNDAQLSFPGSWRLSVAALMPGALVMNAGFGLYAIGVLDVVQLIAVAVVHLVVGWVYLVYGSLIAPLHPSVSALTHNPFVQSETPPPLQPAGGQEPQVKDSGHNEPAL